MTHATFGEGLPAGAGLTVVTLEFDPSRYDRILISVEPAGRRRTPPSAAVWQTAS